MLVPFNSLLIVDYINDYILRMFIIYFTEITNVFFITLFTLEMLLKMYSLGIQVSRLPKSRSRVLFTTLKLSALDHEKK